MKVSRVRYFTFNVKDGKVLKVVVLSVSPFYYHVVFVHHHIALDGFSWDMFVCHLTQAYNTGRLRLGSIHQVIDISAKKLSAYATNTIREELDY